MPYSVPFIFIRCPAFSIKDLYRIPAKDVFFEKGLYLASFDFWKQYQRLDLLKPDQRQRVENTLLNYWMRACFRSTPFGLFAGTTLVNLSSNSTSIILKDREQHFFINRIDSKFLLKIIEFIEKYLGKEGKVKYSVNNTIYKLNDCFRFISYDVADHDNRKYILEEIERSELLDDIKTFFEKGREVNELKDFIKHKVVVSEEDVELFISEMISCHFLVSELTPPITGKDKLEVLINQLEKGAVQNSIVSDLKNLNILIKQKQNAIHDYNQIGLKIAKIINSDKEVSSFMQTDLTLATQNAVINEDLINELVDQIERLMIFIRNRENVLLEEFKKSFLARYDKQWVPLCEVLDPDQGIGYGNYLNQLEGNNLIDDINIENSARSFTLERGIISNFVFKKYDDFINSENSHITISEKDLKFLSEKVKKPNLSNSLTLMGILMKKSGVLDAQNFYFELKTLFGPSAASVMGRFAYDGSLLHKKLKELLKQEELGFPNSVLAEIVYSPQEKHGNVVSRACLRDYEIPILNESGTDQLRRIKIGDLFVTVIDDEIILFSSRLNKRVIPRLSNAHNFQNNELPVYKFLCDLQSQKFANSAIWDWGFLEDFSFLPRVVYKDIILKKATWVLKIDDIVKDRDVDYESFSIYIDKYRHKRKIPGQVVYKEADNEQLIDFSRKEGLRLLFEYLKRKKVLKVEEFLNTAENSIVYDEKNNPYLSELVIPLSQVSKNYNDPIYTMPNIVERRLFPINSEWLYFKIYCSEKTADKLIANELFILSQHIIQNGDAELFFFIRYRDPQNHIRLRFHNSDASKNIALQKKIIEVMSPHIVSRSVQKVSIDTYVRELERYHNFIEESETFFYADSLCAMRLLGLMKEDNDPVGRLLLSMRSIDAIFDDLGFTEIQKRDFMKEVYAASWRKTTKGKETWDKCNKKYAQIEKKVYAFMQRNDKELYKIFTQRKEDYRKATYEIQKRVKEVGIGHSVSSLIQDYIHLLINRLFTSKQKNWELLVCFSLEKYYYSKSMRRNS